MSPFTHHCTACERVQLIFPTQLAGVAETDQGVVLAFTCWCGAAQTYPLQPADRRTDDVAAA
ncbi:hypothetical protein [Nocardioides rubriscoriae]|uniref:hypothetical protein n=1 Tax=Nocardioides rubriscoriae TaxID=642762 RepID=UPI0011E02807|nr:hypothetical protein [Nocardioides rubriscoriae]